LTSYEFGRGPVALLLGLALAAVLTAAVAHAQNLDEGKSPAKLFANGCSTCHRSPRGLAKGRFSLTLYWFLREHYATGPDSAKALAAYLESVDGGGGGKSRAASKLSHAAGPLRAPRPPAPVLGR